MNGRILGGNLRPGADPRIKLYDFRRPDKFSKDQIRTVSIMHETFARLATARLSADLRRLAEVHVALVDQVTYQEFLQELTNPTTLGVIDMAPLKGSALLEIDPSVAFSFLDRLLGGQGERVQLTRDLTGIEQSVMEGTIGRMLGNLRESWSTMIDLQPRLGGIEVNPLFVQIVPPSEMVVLVAFQVRVGPAEGTMRLCLPYLTIEPLIPKLSARYWYSRRCDRRMPGIPPATRGRLKVAAELYLEAEELPLRELLHLRRGRLIRLPGYDRGEAFLQVGKHPLIRLRREGHGCPSAGASQGGRQRRRDGQAADLRPGRWWKRRRDGSGPELTFSVEPEEEAAGDRPAPPDPAETLAGLVRASEDSLRREMQELFRQLNHSIQSLAEPLGPLPPPAPGAHEEEAPGGPGHRPFGFVGAADVDFLATLLARESAQTAAMVLSYLEPNIAARILARLAEEVRAEVVARIAAMDRISPDTLSRVERAIEAEVRAAGAGNLSDVGGVEAAADILDLAGRSVEKQTLDALRQKDPALAEEIQARRFGFEDLALLDNKALQAVLKRVDRRDLLLALKAAEERIAGKILESFSPSERSEMQKAGKEMGVVRFSEVEAAQRRIVNVMCTLADSGSIKLGRGEESP